LAVLPETKGQTMSIKLTDTQLLMLSAAAQREDRCIAAPPSLKGSAAQKIATKLVAAGLAKETKAKPGAHVWRRDDATGLAYALKVTPAGLMTIAIEDAEAAEPAYVGLALCKGREPAIRRAAHAAAELRAPRIFLGLCGRRDSNRNDESSQD